jgi:hypothetical protein
MVLEKPIRFKELCEKVGFALMMGQKVQFALAYYYAVYHMVNSGWSKERANGTTAFHLSRPMGVVVNSIEKDAHLGVGLSQRVIEFKTQRNWLAHDFDQESTPFLSQNQKFDFYIERMEQIANQASSLMLYLNEIGKKLGPVGI